MSEHIANYVCHHLLPRYIGKDGHGHGQTDSFDGQLRRAVMEKTDSYGKDGQLWNRFDSYGKDGHKAFT